MKIALLGKSGQLGQYLVSDLAAAGFEVHAFDSTQLDITKPVQLNKILSVMKPEIVINVTAYNLVDKAEHEPNKAFDVNAFGVKHVAQISHHLGARFITISSDYVFGGNATQPYTEKDLPSPKQTYGISKLTGEYFATAYAPDSVIIRTSGVYGKNGSTQKGSNFVLDRIRDAQSKKEIEVASNQWCTPTYAADLSRAICQLVGIPYRGVIHITNQGNCSWAEFSREIFTLLGSRTRVKGVVRNLSLTPQRPAFTILDCSVAQKLGISLPSWTDALKRYLAEIGESKSQIPCHS